MKDKLEKYEEIMLLMKKLEEEKEALAESIKEEMIKQGADKSPKLKAGYIVLASRKSFKYSGEIDDLNEIIKEKKKEEELNGLAEVSVTQYLTYKKSA